MLLIVFLRLLIIFTTIGIVFSTAHSQHTTKDFSIVTTAIVQYNAGNICSVINALRRIGVEPIVTSNPEEIMSADRVIFPGQGEAATTIAHLKRSGLDRVIKELRQPVLGICIGQQLLCEHSDEGDTPCLNVFEGSRVQKFIAPEGVNLKVPHMGWNTIENTHSPLFKDLALDSYVYFVHSFYAPVCEWTIAETNYGGIPFSAAMRRDNFFATQFHPEKSGTVGEQILTNFMQLDL